MKVLCIVGLVAVFALVDGNPRPSGRARRIKRQWYPEPPVNSPCNIASGGAFVTLYPSSLQSYNLTENCYPEKPAQYPNNADWKVVFNIPPTGDWYTYVNIRYTIDIEYNDLCTWDSVTFGANLEPDKQVFICGQQTGEFSVQNTQSEYWVTFRSDIVVTAQGFNIEIDTSPYPHYGTGDLPKLAFNSSSAANASTVPYNYDSSTPNYWDYSTPNYGGYTPSYPWDYPTPNYGGYTPSNPWDYPTPNYGGYTPSYPWDYPTPNYGGYTPSYPDYGPYPYPYPSPYPEQPDDYFEEQLWSLLHQMLNVLEQRRNQNPPQPMYAYSGFAKKK